MSEPSDKNTPSLYDFFLHRRHKRINKWHHYFRIYERHLEKWKRKKVTLLEIGVFKGGSLQMWKHCFPDDSQIVGIDIIPSRKRHETSRVKIFIGDSADAAFLRGVLDEVGPLDIVIDDGGHTARQQINAFEALYPSLSEDGVYIVEDTHTSFWPEFIDTPDRKTFLQFAHEKTLELHEWTGNRDNFDLFNIEPAKRTGKIEVSEFCRTTDSIHFYDSVVVFEKTVRPEPWHQDIGRWF